MRLILHKAYLCPGSEELLSTISSDFMEFIYMDILVPFGQKQSDDFKNRLATELHPDPFDRVCNTQQKWVSSDILNFYGMYLCDLSRNSSVPNVYHVGPYVTKLYLQNSGNYITEYIK